MKKKTKTRKVTSRKQRPADPYAEREAQKYTHPIPSREAILDWLEQTGQPLRFERLAADLRLQQPDAIEALNRRLAAMLRDGQLVQNRR
ncbi:MAG: ribonuclease R, partial [Gammaproteobacteria bacterium]